MKKKVILTSILTIALCLSLIAGSTFALFTSESSINVAVTAGKVEVVATADNFVLSSTLGTNLTETTYSNADNTVTLTNMVPGDKLTFDITVENNSNVTVKYRTVIAKVSDNGLWNGLEVTIGGETYDGSSKVSNWAVLQPDSADLVIPVAVTLPEGAGNEYQSKTCTFAYTVEAVQGNADVTDAPAEDDPAAENYYTVATAEELKALSAKALTQNNNVAEEAIIDIVSDINMEGVDAFSSIIAQRGDKLTVKGNGNKISNINIVSGENDNTTGQAAMFYAYPNSTLTVSNLVIENATVTAEENGTGYAAAVVGFCEGDAVLNNVDIVNATVIGEKSSGLFIGYNTGSVTATGCDATGTVTLTDHVSGGHYAGKVIGTIGGNISLNNCTYNATVSGNLNAANVGDMYGRLVSGFIMIDGVASANSQDSLNAAISNGATDIELAAGTYQLTNAVNNKEVTITGTEDTKIDVTSGLSFINGSTVTFEGVTIESNPQGAGYTNGFADGQYAIFNNCVINGTLGLDYSCEFNGCEFNIEGNYYNVWTWGAGTATFNKCTFNCDGKALLVYANVLDNGTTHQTVKITDCVFNDNGDDTVTGKAAIEITNTYTPIRTYDVFITNTTVNGFSQTVPGAGDFNATYGSVAGSDIGTNVWGNKMELPNTQINVVIDGVDVY